MLNAMKMLHYFQSLKNTQMHSEKERVGSPSFLTPILFRAVSSLHRSLAEKATACGLFLRLTDSFTRHKAARLTALVIHTSIRPQTTLVLPHSDPSYPTLQSANSPCRPSPSALINYVSQAG